MRFTATSVHGLLFFGDMMRHIPVHVLLLPLIGFASAAAQQQAPQPLVGTARDSAAAVAVVSRFHEALASGDTITVDALLAADLKVLESGGVESRSEYFAHHLAADMEFAKAVRAPRTLVFYAREGNTAWLVSTSAARGTFRKREVNSVGAELMILTNTQGGWQIRAIHWSSRKRS